MGRRLLRWIGVGQDRAAVTPGRVKPSTDTRAALVLYSRQGEIVTSTLQSTGLGFEVIGKKECPVKVASFRTQTQRKCWQKSKLFNSLIVSTISLQYSTVLFLLSSAAALFWTSLSPCLTQNTTLCSEFTLCSTALNKVSIELFSPHLFSLPLSFS